MTQQTGDVVALLAAIDAWMADPDPATEQLILDARERFSLPPSDEDVERAARAMCRANNFSFNDFNDATKDKYRRMARAALVAGRSRKEP